MKKITSILIAVLILAVCYWVYLPSPVEAVSFSPPPAPALVGPLAPNTLLQQANLLALGKIDGPEDTAVDNAGQVYAGLSDGRIIRVLATGEVADFAQTGGRPLGMEFDAQHNLIVCDAFKGLLSVAPDGKITTLTTAADGIPLGFTDALAIDHAGMIYFSDASTKFTQRRYMLDFFEGKPHGRLIRFDPVSKTTKVLLTDLYFANGVALSKAEDFILINETYRFQIRRFWLNGEKAGKNDIFIANLPGFPDNLSSDKNGTFWVAFPSLRKADAEWMLDKPFVKNMVAKLPKQLLPKPTRYGMVVQIDEKAAILQSLQDPSGDHLRMITSVKPYKDTLYFGSLENDRIGSLKTPGLISNK